MASDSTLCPPAQSHIVSVFTISAAQAADRNRRCDRRMAGSGADGQRDSFRQNPSWHNSAERNDFSTDACPFKRCQRSVCTGKKASRSSALGAIEFAYEWLLSKKIFVNMSESKRNGISENGIGDARLRQVADVKRAPGAWENGRQSRQSRVRRTRLAAYSRKPTCPAVCSGWRSRMTLHPMATQGPARLSGPSLIRSRSDESRLKPTAATLWPTLKPMRTERFARADHVCHRSRRTTFPRIARSS